MERVRELQPGVAAAIEGGALIVTANERSARGIRRAYDRERVRIGEDRWSPAEVVSWRAWTASLWREMVLEGRATSLLLNRVQEHAVWRGVLDTDTEMREARGLDGLASMAASAWSRVCGYGDRGADTRLAGWGGGEDAAAFVRWAKAFRERCEAEGLLSEAELDGALAQALRTGDLKLGRPTVALLGFDELLPGRRRLIAEVEGAGTAVEMLHGGLAGAGSKLVWAGSADEELRGAATWMRDRVTGGARRLALIVPGLRTERERIERVLRKVLAPEMEDVRSGETGAAFEFSLGRPLAEAPGVRAAMDLLRWAEGPLEIPRVSGVLLSPYFAWAGEGGTQEKMLRAEFDAYRLRERMRLRPELSAGELAREIRDAGRREGRFGDGRMASLLSAVRALERAGAAWMDALASYAEWTQAMRELLAGTGWGAVAGETSLEFQARERWESALDSLATLDFRGGQVSYGTALEALERIVGETVFAPESSEAPVQVMEAGEAAGSEFDAVWVVGAGEMNWPPLEASSPLLPWALQRAFGMPGADVRRDAERARAVTERLARSGAEVVWSYCRTTTEGGTERAAAVVRELVRGEEIALAEEAGAAPARTPIELERTEDGGEVRPLPDDPVRGGAHLLELQAACGFRAFAEGRLWATELDQRELGLDALERGSAVHDALRAFWDDVRDHARLVTMTDEQLREAVNRAVEAGLGTAMATRASEWDAAYLEVQRKRLLRLLERWLDIEKLRMPFEVVASERDLKGVRVGPLRLNVRMDRVDRVDGRLVLIDYKTGTAEVKQWMGERPDRPQVPLYALLANELEAGLEADPAPKLEPGPEETDQLSLAAGAGEVGPGGERLGLGAVGFASVRAGKFLKLQGLEAQSGLLVRAGRGKKPVMDATTFEGQVELWEQVLTALAEEYARGDARVRPKNYPVTCQHCGQRMLCRLDASLLEEMEEDEEENGEEENG